MRILPPSFSTILCFPEDDSFFCTSYGIYIWENMSVIYLLLSQVRLYCMHLKNKRWAEQCCCAFSFLLHQKAKFHFMSEVAFYVRRLILKCSNSCGRNSTQNLSGNDLKWFVRYHTEILAELWPELRWFFNAWWVTYLEASGLMIGFSYLQTSRGDVDMFLSSFLHLVK